MDISKLDKNMAVRLPGSGLCWYDAAALTLEGRGWDNTEGRYERLPKRVKGLVRESVWELSKSPAGMAVRFITDSPELALRWDGFLAMTHMAALGCSGLDLYVRHENRYRWLYAARPEKECNEREAFSGVEKGTREFLLYLPLYNPVKKIELGIARESFLAPAPVRDGKPLVFYGTSITQGGCVSRPGMAYPAILGRRFDASVINLGFSGNGNMEPEIIDLLCELDPAVFVLDALPNMNMEQISERLETGVLKLKKAHPDTPVVLVDHILFCDAYMNVGRMEQYKKKNEAQREIYKSLVQGGAKGVVHVPDNGLIGDDGEASVDGIHFDDIGFERFAASLSPVLADIL